VADDEYFAAMIMKQSNSNFQQTINAFHQYFRDLREKVE